MLRGFKFAAVFLAAVALWPCPSARAANTVPAAVIQDPPRDAAHPAHNQQVLVPSDGKGMNAQFFLAAGAGPKPTMLLLHGIPGNEQNLDLAQAVRRAGWNVLTLHYRGSWGSPGQFSLQHSVEDTAAAMAFLHDPKMVAKFGIDPKRIVIAGHSMGGFTTAMYVARHNDFVGYILIDPWNVGANAKMLHVHPEKRKAYVGGFDDFGNSLVGADPESITEEVEHHPDWDLIGFAPALARHPGLFLSAEFGNAEANKPLTAAIEARPGAQLTFILEHTDHPFADHRIALCADVVRWLKQFETK